MTMTRRIPDTMMTLHGEQVVIRSEAFPAHGHPERSPIKADMPVVRVTLADGSFRWFGCESAFINSRLQMVLTGLNPKDEVRKAWPRVRHD